MSKRIDQQKRRVLDFIAYRREFFDESPTIRQIASALFMGKSTVRQAMKALQADGSLEGDYKATHGMPKANEGAPSVYKHDKAGAVMSPGRSYETTPLHELHNTYVTVAAHTGNVPAPEYALVDYRAFPGMERFTEREKDVFILSVACLMTGSEIAKHLDISDSTVRTLLETARKKCEQSLDMN